MSKTSYVALITGGVILAGGALPFAMSGTASAQGQSGGVLALNLKGTGAMYPGTVPDIDGDGVDDAAMCFDVDAIDVGTNLVVGTATDCLANVTPVGSGLSVVGTTYFNLQGANQIITRGLTTVQPATGYLGGFTHVTGAVPSGGNDVVGGAGAFANATGAARLSGLVDMSSFGGQEGQTITFDCLFLIDLD